MGVRVGVLDSKVVLRAVPVVICVVSEVVREKGERL